MSYPSYMASRLWELLLVFVSALSMSMVGFNAFYLRGMGDLMQFVVAFPAILVLLLVLFYAAWDRKHLPIGIVLTIACAIALTAGAMSLSTGENLWQDMDGNYLYFAAVIVASTVGCFALTRTIPGSIVWFVVVVFLCAVIQAMYLMNEYVFSLLAAFVAISVPLFTNVFFDEILSGRNRDWGTTFITAMGGVALFAFLLEYLKDKYSLRIAGSLALKGNVGYLQHLLHLPMSFYAMRYVGDLQQRQHLNERITKSLVDVLAPQLINIALLLMAGGMASVSPASILPYLYYQFALGIFCIIAIVVRYPRRYS